ncbi:MAG: ABC transporter ATP-binding protein [Saprospiraceae bacterium]|nr:ABC transporter ATP-binding protein [Pyrinomonadaceae bacterium]
MSLQVITLSKRYADIWILRDVSFEAERGKITGLFGVSGSGKTTVLKTIAGIEKTNGGTVTFDSKNASGLSREARNFYFSVPASSFLSSLLKSDGSAQLSGGERAAANVENALASDAEVLLLDDPFCSMDSFTKHKYFEKLRKSVNEKNLAVVFATSNYDDVFALCDSVAVLGGGGEIIQTGTPQDVYSEPRSYAVARITGRNNLFEARRLTSSKAEHPQFQTLTGEHRLVVEKIERNALGSINQNVWLCIRPEHISIAFGASFPEDNLLMAVITGVQLMGSTTLVELNANGLVLHALVLRLVGLNIGDECMLGLPPNWIQVLKS